MATWPANGAVDWNTKMLAYLAIGHDADGTHKKSQLLTDMEWSPTAYAGGESVTSPNGFIIKMGYTVRTGTETTVTFGTAFPEACIAALPVSMLATAVSAESHLKQAPTAAAFIIVQGGAVTGFFWIAVGH